MQFDASAERHQTEGYQLVTGQITYTGLAPVRDVRVCASGTCVQVTGPGMTMTQGASQKFSVRKTGLDTPVVTAQCSVMIDGPGL